MRQMFDVVQYYVGSRPASARALRHDHNCRDAVWQRFGHAAAEKTRCTAAANPLAQPAI